MIAEQNEFMQEASQAIYELSADEMIRQRCFAREEHLRWERTIERDKALLQAQLDDTQSKLDDAQKLIAEQDKLIAQLLAEKNANKLNTP